MNLVASLCFNFLQDNNMCYCLHMTHLIQPILVMCIAHMHVSFLEEVEA